MFCQTCGVQLTDAFCTKCGAPARQPLTPEQKRRAQVVMYIVLTILGVIGLLIAVGMVRFICCGWGSISRAQPEWLAACGPDARA